VLFRSIGNSDELKIGEWVLAVGNPFNLTSTVTAGIVSAKARNINLLSERNTKEVVPIESFIQTDAAVNPGNSGGALVNTRGELIGINTAIASQTGSYSGYSFAVPVNLVDKVMRDLIDFGIVQRGYLGVQISDITQEIKEKNKLPDLKGVFLAKVVEGGSADKAGLKDGDVIHGFEVIDTRGHTPGHHSFRLKSNDQQIIFVGDIVHSHSLQFDAPKTGVDFDVNSEQAINTRLKMFAEISNNQQWVAAPHLPFPGIGHVYKVNAEQYQWIPLYFDNVVEK
jgi:hypothetical protein